MIFQLGSGTFVMEVVSGIRKKGLEIQLDARSSEDDNDDDDSVDFGSVTHTIDSCTM